MRTFKLSNYKRLLTVDDVDYCKCTAFKWFVTFRNCELEIVSTLSLPAILLENFVMNDFKHTYKHKDNNPFNFTRDNLERTTHHADH